MSGLIRDLRENPAKPRSSLWPLGNLYRSNELGEFSLNEEQAEVFFSILDALAPDCGSPPPRSRAAIAEFELETTLDVLNFFASFFYLNDRLPALSGHHKNEHQNALFTRKQNSEGFNIRFEVKFFHDVFDPQKISKDKEINLAFEKTNKLLLNPNNALEERYLSAIKWAGKGSITKNRENAFIFYAIALESLLLGKKHHEQLSYKLRLRAAHLMGMTNSGRFKICHRVNELYSLRSKIVHSGAN